MGLEHAWVLRAHAHMAGQSTAPWDEEFGPWDLVDEKALARLVLKDFNESQPRDEAGRWTDAGGGGGGGGRRASPSRPLRPHCTT